jgi:NADPH2:quinone reductase
VHLIAEEDDVRAVRFHGHGGPDVLRVEEVPIPETRPGMVQVRVRAAGLNFADVLQRQGRYVDPVRLPASAGLEVAGEVSALGEGVSGLRVGQRVMGLARGAFAEYAVTLPQLLFAIPDTMSDEEAAALPIQGLTAYHGLKTMARLAPGERVLVHAAAGGVGLLSSQVAKCLGAAAVYGTASTADKRALAEQHGVDATIDYTREDLVARVKELTEGKGVDVVMDGVGGEVLLKSLDCLATFGRVVMYGRASGVSSPLDPWRLVPQSWSVLGFYLPRIFQRPGLPEAGMAELTRWYQEGRLRIVVGQTFDLAAVGDAQRALEGRQTVGKVVIRIG